MKISLKANCSVEIVLGIYSIDGTKYFCCIPDGHTGLIVFSEHEVAISDGLDAPSYFIVISGGRYHPAIKNSSLLEGLLEHDPKAYSEFRLALAKFEAGA